MLRARLKYIVPCPEIGNKKSPCLCPRRLAQFAGKIFRLKPIFETLGRCGSNLNPAVTTTVANYLSEIGAKQSIAHVTPFQAKPIFIKKLHLIALYIDRHLEKLDISPISRFIFARDQALFKFIFFSGDRAHDAGIMLIQEIRLLPENAGYLIRHTTGKTHRVDKPRIFSLFRCAITTLCPVEGLQQYISIAGSMGITLSSGYLFRPTCLNMVLDKSLSYAAIYERFQFYLNQLGINEGETPHSFRGGCAITFREVAQANQASSTEALMQHVGWATEWSAAHYSRSHKQEYAATMARAMSFSCENLLSKADGNGFMDHSELAKAFP
jgi:integrase